MNAGPSGFRNAPVTKALVVTTAGTTMAAALFNLRDKLDLVLHPGLTSNFELWRLVTSNFLFKSPGEIILGITMLYGLRVFERQMGSPKFGGFVVISYSVSTLLQLAAMVLFRSLPKSASGPLGLVFAGLVQVYYDIPRSFPFRVFNVSLNDKFFTYLLALQLLFSHPPYSLVTGLCGSAAGFLYRTPVFPMRNFTLPAFINNFCKRFILPLIASPPGPAGRPAQRQRPRGGGGGGRGGGQPGAAGGDAFDTLLPQFQAWPPAAGGGGGGGGAFGFGGGGGGGGGVDGLAAFGLGNAAQPAAPPAPPNEEHVTMLTGMGFSRQQVLAALGTAHGNVEVATNLLLD